MDAMDEASNISVLHVTMASLTGFFAVLAAIVHFIRVYIDGDQTEVRRRFESLWLNIDQGPWLSMPELAIRQSLKLNQVIGGPLGFQVFGKIARISPVSGPVTAIVGAMILWGWIGVGAAFAGSVLLRVIPSITGPPSNSLLGRSKIIILLLYFAPTTMIWIIISLDTHIVLSAVIMLVVLPTSGTAVYLVIGTFTSDKIANGVLVPAFAVGFSFVVTFIALLIGNVVAPNLYVPQTLQMLSINALFDGLTVVATFALLMWAVQADIMRRIPFAIGVDVLVGAVLACASLYLGLIFTDQALTVTDTINVLVFRSPDGQSVELGPFFWVMHSTFLPTLGYIGLILLLWSGKLLLVPVAMFVEKGADHSNPLNLTRTLLVTIAAIFGAITTFLTFGI